jgi:hypothetical protein
MRKFKPDREKNRKPPARAVFFIDTFNMNLLAPKFCTVSHDYILHEFNQASNCGKYVLTSAREYAKLIMRGTRRKCECESFSFRFTFSNGVGTIFARQETCHVALHHNFHSYFLPSVNTYMSLYIPLRIRLYCVHGSGITRNRTREDTKYE